MKVTTLFSKMRAGVGKIFDWNGIPYVATALVLCYLLFPFYWTFVTSFKSLQEIFKWPPTLVPQQFTLSAYIFSLIYAPVPRYVVNSVIYSLSVALFVILIGTITTYGLTIYSYRGSNEISFLFFATRIVPPQVLWLPLYVVYSKLGLIDTRLGVIIFQIALAYPLCVWILRGMFQAFPRELVDAASIDGSSRLGILFRIVMPIAAPGIAATGIVAFLWAWGSFMFPFLILDSEALKPLTVGVYYFVGEEGILWNALAATEVLALLPGITFFIIAQRYIIKGLSAGATR